MKSCIVCLFLVLVSLAPRVEAQFNSHKSVSLQGQVESGSERGAGLIVVLSPTGERNHQADVGPGGDFEFWELSSGQYELTVMTLYGDVIQREFLSLDSTTNRVTVRLPDSRT